MRLETVPNIMVSAFDAKFMAYGVRMYSSFQRLNPNTKVYFADLGILSEDNMAILDRMGVGILKAESDFADFKGGRGCIDQFMEDFVKHMEWDRMMWMDADTMVLRPLEHLFNKDFDFLGHPDRNHDGLLLKNKGRDRFASGMYVMRSRKLLAEYRAKIKHKPHATADDHMLTDAVHEGLYSYQQLDGNLFNFSRDAIPLARYDPQKRMVYYDWRGNRYYPYTAGFSRSRGDVRHDADGIEAFYRDVIDIDGNDGLITMRVLAQSVPEAVGVAFIDLFRWLKERDRRPTRIIEIETACGGLALWARARFPQVEMVIYSSVRPLLKEELLDAGAQVVHCDVVEEERAIAAKIQSPGTTLLICRGDKGLQARKMFRKHLKPGDVMLTRLNNEGGGV